MAPIEARRKRLIHFSRMWLNILKKEDEQESKNKNSAKPRAKKTELAKV